MYRIPGYSEACTVHIVMRATARAPHSKVNLKYFEHIQIVKRNIQWLPAFYTLPNAHKTYCCLYYLLYISIHTAAIHFQQNLCIIAFVFVCVFFFPRSYCSWYDRPFFFIICVSQPIVPPPPLVLIVFVCVRVTRVWIGNVILMSSRALHICSHRVRPGYGLPSTKNARQ